MSRTVDLLNYFTSRASRSSDDIREEARKAIGLAYELFWAPVTVSKAIISIGLGLSPVRAFVLTPLQIVQRSRSVRAHIVCLRYLMQKGLYEYLCACQMTVIILRVLQGGKLITFTLLDANGKTTCTQPVWAQWDYDVAGLLGESLHLLTVLPNPVCMRFGKFCIISQASAALMVAFLQSVC